MLFRCAPTSTSSRLQPALARGRWGRHALRRAYAVSGSGWFGDRSVCYLASGRPVIAQDTGFGRRLPRGAGLYAFASADDVIPAIEELERDYDCNRSAARQIAAQYLDSDRVLGSLLERLL